MFCNSLVRGLVSKDDVERVDDVDALGTHVGKVAPLAVEKLLEALGVQLTRLLQRDFDVFALPSALQYID